MQFRLCTWAAVVAVASAALPPPDADGKYTLTAPGIRAQVRKSLPIAPLSKFVLGF